MTQETPERPVDGDTPNAELRTLIDEWRTDADKISQATGVEPTTLIRCAEDLETLIDESR